MSIFKKKLRLQPTDPGIDEVSSNTSWSYCLPAVQQFIFFLRKHTQSTVADPKLFRSLSGLVDYAAK
jgi:hypothetical protein